MSQLATTLFHSQFRNQRRRKAAKNELINYVQHDYLFYPSRFQTVYLFFEKGNYLFNRERAIHAIHSNLKNLLNRTLCSEQEGRHKSWHENQTIGRMKTFVVLVVFFYKSDRNISLKDYKMSKLE